MAAAADAGVPTIDGDAEISAPTIDAGRRAARQLLATVDGAINVLDFSGLIKANKKAEDVIHQLTAELLHARHERCVAKTELKNLAARK